MTPVYVRNRLWQVRVPLLLLVWCWGHVARWFKMDSPAEINDCIIESLIRRSGPEVEVIALRLALEATECILGEVGREGTTTWRR